MIDQEIHKGYCGQVKFQEALEKDFSRVYRDSIEESFQSAWKNATGIPSHGNSNPNYNDGIAFLEYVVEGEYNHLIDSACPILPYCRNFEIPKRAGDINRNAWMLQWHISHLYRHLVVSGAHTRPVRDGVLQRLVFAGLVTVNGFNEEKVREYVCNHFSDTQEENQEQ